MSVTLLHSQLQIPSVAVACIAADHNLTSIISIPRCCPLRATLPTLPSSSRCYCPCTIAVPALLCCPRCCPPTPPSSPRHPSRVTAIPLSSLRCYRRCVFVLLALLPSPRHRRPRVAARPRHRPPRAVHFALPPFPRCCPPHATIFPVLMPSMGCHPPRFVAVVPELRVVEAIPLTVDERPLHPRHQSHRRVVYVGRLATNLVAVRIVVVLIAVGHGWSN